MESAGILLVGQSISQIRQLVATMSDTPINDSSNATIWNIDNKYYEAEVSLNMLSLDESVDLISPPPLATTACQAVILVFDATSADEFTCVRTWKEKCCDQDTVELTLAVALYPENVRREEPPPHVQEAEQWCLDEMYELVHVDVKSFGDARSILLEDDEEGVGRLLQALQAHMWPGMTRKRPQRRPAAGDDVGSLDADEGGEPSELALIYDNAIAPSIKDDDADDLETIFTELTSKQSMRCNVL